MKSVLLPDHIPMNKFELIVVGAPGPLRFTTVAGLTQELQTVDLPDRTKASGGNLTSVEFTASHPKHHVVEDAFLESWFLEGQDPVSPTYKKAGNLVVKSLSGLIVKGYTLINLFVSQRVTPDLDMANEGELFVTEWTFMADNILPI